MFSHAIVFVPVFCYLHYDGFFVKFIVITVWCLIRHIAVPLTDKQNVVGFYVNCLIYDFSGTKLSVKESMRVVNHFKAHMLQ